MQPQRLITKLAYQRSLVIALMTPLLLLGMLFPHWAPGAVALAAPATQEVAPSARLTLLSATNSPILQTLGMRFAVTTAPVNIASTDDAAIRQALGSATALGVDLANVSVDAIKQGHWFQLAHTLNVPMILENAEAAKVAAITGFGQSGQLVLLRPSQAGRHVDMAVLGQQGDKTSAMALTDAVVTLLNRAAEPQALPPMPNLPVRAQRIWDVEAVLYLGPNQIIFSHQKQFKVANANQTYTDDVNFSVGLYAASDKKWLVVDSAGGSGITTGNLMTNTDTDRGWYLESYVIDMAPKQGATLPPGFTLYKTAPEAVNNVGNYSTSAGFSVGAGTDGVLTGQFEQSRSGSVNVPDFAIQNFSVGVGAHWK